VQDDQDVSATARTKQRRRCGSGGAGVGGWNGVEIPATIAAKNHGLGLQILNREAKSVKLNGTVIIASKLSNR